MKRTPLKHHTPLKAKTPLKRGNGRLKIRRDELDVLFSECVRKLAMKNVGGCERCLSPKKSYKELECAHFNGRAMLSVRFDLDNAIGACMGCHTWLDSHAVEKVEFWKQRLGEECFALLEARKRIMYPKPDKQAITLYNKEMIRILDSEAQG